jgi:hypothetical protein
MEVLVTAPGPSAYNYLDLIPLHISTFHYYYFSGLIPFLGLDGSSFFGFSIPLTNMARMSTFSNRNSRLIAFHYILHVQSTSLENFIDPMEHRSTVSHIASFIHAHDLDP